MAIGATTRQTATTARPGPHPPSLARNICIAVLALLVLVGLVVLITWAVIRPKKLVFSIDEASIHEYNLTNSKLNSTFDFTLRAYNPNRRVSVYYDVVQVYVQYDGQVVATRVMDPFFLGHKDVTRLRGEAVARNIGLSGTTEANLKGERTDGSVDLDVQVRGKIRYKVGRWKSGHYKLKVLCSPVVVFSDPKRFQPVTCDV